MLADFQYAKFTGPVSDATTNHIYSFNYGFKNGGNGLIVIITFRNIFGVWAMRNFVINIRYMELLLAEAYR